jgi:transcription elongation factor GreA
MSDEDKIKLTKKGFENLQKELETLKEEKRPKMVKRLSEARAEGDLSENSDYTAAREELEFLDGRISELEDVIKRADVIRGNGASDQVSVGTSVTVGVNGQKHTYNIVGEWEADPKEKKISHTSPLGQALVGKKVGHEVEVEAPAGKITYKVLQIN